MDEVLFHVSQCLEAVQVHLHLGAQHGWQLLQNFSEQAEAYAVEAWSSPRSVQFRNGFQQGIQHLLELGQQLKEQSAVILNPSNLYQHLAQLLGTEMTRSSLCFGCIGFVLGGAIGVSVGLAWQRRAMHVPRMKAVICNSYRGLDSLMMVDDIPIPAISKPDDILVQVKAASVDVTDVKICSGYGRVLRKQMNRYNCNALGEFPVILGRDCAGIVVEIGQKVSKFEIGDEVWLAVPYWSSGTMAEYIVVSEDRIARKPKAVGFEIAASIPYAGTTAWNAIFNKAGLNTETIDGKRVLVHLGCSPVGCMLIQLTRMWGAHVTTTCSLQAVQVVKALGAHDVVIYGQDDMEKQLALHEGFDIVFNTEGAVAYKPCLNFCSPGGHVITTFDSEIASDMYGFFRRSLYGLWICLKYFMQDKWESEYMRPSVLDQLAQLLQDGSLQPVVDKIFAVHDAELAFQHTDSSHAIGKTIVRFRSQRRLQRLRGRRNDSIGSMYNMLQ